MAMKRTVVKVALAALVSVVVTCVLSSAVLAEDDWSDSSYSSWQANQAINDRCMEAWSDAMLGYQDVYNPNTGEVVEAWGGYNSYYSDDRGTLWGTDSYSIPGGATEWQAVDGLSAWAW